MEYKIPLRDKTKNIINHTLVSEKVYIELKKYKWHISKYGYVQGRVDKKLWLLHRYIFEIILKTDIKNKLISPFFSSFLYDVEYSR